MANSTLAYILQEITPKPKKPNYYNPLKIVAVKDHRVTFKCPIHRRMESVRIREKN